MSGRARVESEYDWEKKIDRILNVYARASRFHRAVKEAH
jgi:hypothetical protein